MTTDGKGFGESLKPLVSVPCEALTKKKRPCPNFADQTDGEGKWLCHLHNPRMLYRQQVLAKREDRKACGRRQRRNARVTVSNADRQQKSAPISNRHGVTPLRAVPPRPSRITPLSTTSPQVSTPPAIAPHSYRNLA